MQPTEIRKEIKLLTNLIRYHNEYYFQKGISKITDYEYDRLLEQLIQLETDYPHLKLPYSPTEKLGEYPSQIFLTSYHQFPMLSLSKTYSEEAVVQFVTRMQKIIPDSFVNFTCEPKIDGVALSIIYEKGSLKRIVTRGDGEKGDNITNHASSLLKLPRNINIPHYKNFEIRGEACMSHAVFESLNKIRIENGEPLWANPRNITSGTLKALDTNLVKERQLDFYAYSFYSQTNSPATQEGALKLLYALGFSITPTYKVCHNVSDIMDYIHYWKEYKNIIPFGIDGIVIKINNLQQQQIIGITAKSPRWAIAYKYQPKIAHSILEKVTFQVGRTGIVTPVAYFNSILLAGTVIRRASLHNADEIAKKNLHIGDTIFIEKGGDIIPKIIGVDFTKRSKEMPQVSFAQLCPVCSTILLQNKGESAYYCPNKQKCPPQLKGKILHFSHRKAMDIGCLGPQTIHTLFEAKLIQTVVDLYTLNNKDINKLIGFQLVSTKKLLSNIQTSKSKPFEKVLFALSIKHIGATIAKKLALYFKSIEKLQHATRTELLQVPDIGEKIVQSILDYFKDPYEQEILTKLRQQGLQFSVPEKGDNFNKTLSFPKNFVISGIFQRVTREELTKRIIEIGGTVLRTISPKVDYLVIGETPGSSKLAKATILKIPILKEDDIMKMIQL